MTAYGLSSMEDFFNNRRLSVSGSTRFATSDRNSINPQASINFLDLVMPNTNGYEICGQLQFPLSIPTPIIILTG